MYKTIIIIYRQPIIIAPTHTCTIIYVAAISQAEDMKNDHITLHNIFVFFYFYF